MMFYPQQENINDDMTLPLLDSDNVIPSEYARNSSPTIMATSSSGMTDSDAYVNTDGSDRIHTQGDSSSSSSSTTILSNPLIYFLTIPMTIFFQAFTTFQKYVYTNFVSTTGSNNNNGRYNIEEESEFLSSIPQEQDVLQNNIDHLNNNQHDLSQNIDDLTQRVQKLEERRRKRELVMKQFEKEYNGVSDDK